MIARSTQDIFNEAKIKSKRKENILDFETFLKSYSPNIFSYNNNGTISKKEISIVMDAIRTSGSYGTIKFLQDLYDLIIKNLRENYGWKTAPPHRFLMRRRVASRYSTLKFRQRQNNTFIEDIFWRSILDIKNLSPIQRATQIIISSSLYGAVLDKAVLVSLANKSLDDISSFYEYMWFDLEANQKKAVPNTIQRWFSDPVSSQLLRRYKLDSKKRSSTLRLTNFFEIDCLLTEEKLWENIVDVLQKYKSHDELLPKNLSEFIIWIRASFNSSLPGYLVDVSSGVYPSYSMLPEAWLRSITGRSTICAEEISAEDTCKEEDDVGQSYIYKREVVSSSETKYFLKFKKLITLNDIDGYKKYFNETKNKISPATRYICEYYMNLLDGTAPGQFKNKSKSIEKYFSFSEELIAFSQGRDIVNMHVDHISSLYDGIFDQQINMRRQSKIGQFLKHFHNFISKVYGVEKIIFEELDGFIPERHSVNSNVITPHHYDAVLTTFWPTYSFTDRLGYIRYSMTVLGYRLNMRRQEIRRLRICDVRILKTQLFVRVVNTEEGETKTLSGWRWVPAHDLFEKKELSFFKKWHKYRTSETPNRTALIFTESASDLNMISVYKTFDVILKVLRHITGDPKIRFHSLRHSFATWLLICIEANRLPNILDDRFSIFSGESGLKPADFKTLIDGRKPTKKILYQLALIMGHSSPSMTLLHYVHSCDWILYHWCCDRLPRLTVEKISPLLGVNKREVSKVVKEHKLLDQNKKVDLVECLKSYDGWKLKPEWNKL